MEQPINNTTGYKHGWVVMKRNLPRCEAEYPHKGGLKKHYLISPRMLAPSEKVREGESDPIKDIILGRKPLVE